MLLPIVWAEYTRSLEDSPPMTALRFDEMARAIVATRLSKRPNAALRIELLPISHRSGLYFVLSIRWTTVDQAARDGALVRCTGSHDVPAYVAPRIWRYMLWHPLQIV